MQTNLSPLIEATRTFSSLWSSRDWKSVFESECQKKDTPCTKDDFNGECMGGFVYCPLRWECDLMFILGELMYRNELGKVFEDTEPERLHPNPQRCQGCGAFFYPDAEDMARWWKGHAPVRCADCKQKERADSARREE
jgi:hypothetical protein